MKAEIKKKIKKCNNNKNKHLRRPFKAEGMWRRPPGNELGRFTSDAPEIPGNTKPQKRLWRKERGCVRTPDEARQSATPP